MGPHAQVPSIMENLLQKKLSLIGRASSIISLISDMFFFDNGLALRMDIIKWANDNAMKKVYRLQWFRKVGILGRNLSSFKNS